MTATNSHVNAQCSVNAATVNSNGQTVYYVSSQGYPANLAGYLLNSYTEVDCTVQDLDTGGRLDREPRLPHVAVAGVLPFSSRP